MLVQMVSSSSFKEPLDVVVRAFQAHICPCKKLMTEPNTETKLKARSIEDSRHVLV